MSLDKSMDHEDLRCEYQFVIDPVNGHDTLISFDELHNHSGNYTSPTTFTFIFGSYHGQSYLMITHGSSLVEEKR